MKKTSEDKCYIAEFLSFLAADIHHCPERLIPLTACMYHTGNELICGVEIDLDKPLLDEGE
ncbi:hypothetical protein GCM10011369_18980 [Neiella marina]|uniref:Uncharacterized protein n=1 Tax=Neiella marina TaxID=508461 RepID=A0A8J2U557_9GAMM|nr:type II toxin-antitoxin system PrlF family antitoxin [Neiella marina]GGA77320.1 hypothetical protein GCM10011369_18980 [Neiella marina]